MSSLKRKFKNYHTRSHFFSTLRPNSRVLDIGCGSGINGKTLKELHPSIEIYGVDMISENELPYFISYKKVDLDTESLPFPDNYFDTLVFTHVIEHLRNPFQLGKEIKRVLKKGGKIYIEAPNWISALIPSFGFHREQHNPFNFFDDPSHVKPWTKQGFFEFLTQGCDLKVNTIGTVRNWLRVPLDFCLIIVGIILSNRSYITSSFWNLSGWCIYGIASKE
jgi:SAM-dependent methyltransferase